MKKIIRNFKNGLLQVAKDKKPSCNIEVDFFCSAIQWGSVQLSLA